MIILWLHHAVGMLLCLIQVMYKVNTLTTPTLLLIQHIHISVTHIIILLIMLRNTYNTEQDILIVIRMIMLTHNITLLVITIRNTHSLVMRITWDLRVPNEGARDREQVPLRQRHDLAPNAGVVSTW